jgi:hypothetical protein
MVKITRRSVVTASLAAAPLLAAREWHLAGPAVGDHPPPRLETEQIAIEAYIYGYSLFGTSGKNQSVASHLLFAVAPAEAGAQGRRRRVGCPWVPAFAGMTEILSVPSVAVVPQLGKRIDQQAQAIRDLAIAAAQLSHQGGRANGGVSSSKNCAAGARARRIASALRFSVTFI